MTLCIYHGNCADGFGAAWAVREALGDDVEFHAGVYQDPPPDVTGREVFIVDFSYPYDVLCEMSFKAKRIAIIDHHKTAQEALSRLPQFTDKEPDGTYGPDLNSAWAECELHNMPYIAACFDMERSGAGLTWDVFHPGKPRPKLIDHIEDRDLWRFNLPNTREIQAAIFSLPYEFDAWDPWFRTDDLSQLVTEGAAIERKHHKDVAELTQVVTRPMKLRAPWLDGPAPADLGFVVVPMANLPYTLTSDAGHLLCGDEHPFAGCYWDTPEGRVFSLRSRENGADVGEVAKQYGGGGHKHASGFRVPFDQLDQFAAQGGRDG